MPTVKKLSVGLRKKTKSEKPVGNVLQFLCGFERFLCRNCVCTALFHTLSCKDKVCYATALAVLKRVFRQETNQNRIKPILQAKTM